MPEDLDAISLITWRGRKLRDAALATMFVMLCVALAFQIKTNNGVAGRQHDSCVSRRQFAFETQRRQYVLEQFLRTAASARLKLRTYDTSPQARAINLHTAHYWQYRLLPTLRAVPIPSDC